MYGNVHYDVVMYYAHCLFANLETCVFNIIYHACVDSDTRYRLTIVSIFVIQMIYILDSSGKLINQMIDLFDIARYYPS